MLTGAALHYGAVKAVLSCPDGFSSNTGRYQGDNADVPGALGTQLPSGQPNHHCRLRLMETPGPTLESYFCVSTPPCKTDSHEKIEKINGTEKHQDASGAGGECGGGGGVKFQRQEKSVSVNFQ